MTRSPTMRLFVRLPARILYDGAIIRLAAEGAEGGFGLLPNHADFVTALVPSVLLATEPDGRERIFGIDEGLLVKSGHRVEVAVRRGVESDDFDGLRETVAMSFSRLEDEERVARAALSRLEADMVRRFGSLREAGS